MENGECGTEKRTAPRSIASVAVPVQYSTVQVHRLPKPRLQESALMDQPAAPEIGLIHDVIPCIQTLFRDTLILVQATVNLPTPPSHSVTEVSDPFEQNSIIRCISLVIHELPDDLEQRS